MKVLVSQHLCHTLLPVTQNYLVSLHSPLGKNDLSLQELQPCVVIDWFSFISQTGFKLEYKF